MPFVNDIVARQVGDEDWELVAALEYEGNRQKFIVEAGSATDFASVPPMFGWLIPRTGRHSKAAVLHDCLWRSRPMPCTYAEADGIFRRALQELDVPFLRRWLMWAAVRWVSLGRTRFRDGPRDLLRLAVVTAFPGLAVIAAGFVVTVFLAIFGFLEVVVGAGTELLRALGFRTSIGEFRGPALLGHARRSKARPDGRKSPQVKVQALAPSVPPPV